MFLQNVADERTLSLLKPLPAPLNLHGLTPNHTDTGGLPSAPLSSLSWSIPRASTPSQVTALPCPCPAIGLLDHVSRNPILTTHPALASSLHLAPLRASPGSPPLPVPLLAWVPSSPDPPALQGGEGEDPAHWNSKISKDFKNRLKTSREYYKMRVFIACELY